MIKLLLVCVHEISIPYFSLDIKQQEKLLVDFDWKKRMLGTNVLATLIYGIIMDQVDSSVILTNMNISTLIITLQNMSGDVFRTLSQVHEGSFFQK